MRCSKFNDPQALLAVWRLLRLRVALCLGVGDLSAFFLAAGVRDRFARCLVTAGDAVAVVLAALAGSAALAALAPSAFAFLRSFRRAFLRSKRALFLEVRLAAAASFWSLVCSLNCRRLRPRLCAWRV